MDQQQPRRLQIVKEWNPVQQDLVIIACLVQVCLDEIAVTQRRAQLLYALLVGGHLRPSPDGGSWISCSCHALQRFTDWSFLAGAVPDFGFALVDTNPSVCQSAFWRSAYTAPVRSGVETMQISSKYANQTSTSSNWACTASNAGCCAKENNKGIIASLFSTFVLDNRVSCSSVVFP